MRKKVISTMLVTAMALTPMLQYLPVQAAESVLLNMTNKEYDDAVMLQEGVLAKSGNVFATMADTDEYSFMDYDGSETSLTQAVKDNGIDSFYFLTNSSYSSCMFSQKMIVVGKDDKISTMNKKGEVLGEFNYDKATYINEDIYLAEKNDIWAIYKNDGTLIEQLESKGDCYGEFDCQSPEQVWLDDWWYSDEESFVIGEGNQYKFYDNVGNQLRKIPENDNQYAAVAPNGRSEKYFMINIYKEKQSDHNPGNGEFLSKGIYDKKGDLKIGFENNGYFELHELEKYGYGLFNDYTTNRQSLYNEAGKSVLETEEIESYDDKGAIILEGVRANEGMLPEDKYEFVNMDGKQIVDINAAYEDMLGDYRYLTSSAYYANDRLVLSVLGTTQTSNHSGEFDPELEKAQTRVYDMKGNITATLDNVGGCEIGGSIRSQFNGRHMMLYNKDKKQYNVYNYDGTVKIRDFDTAYSLVYTDGSYLQWPSNVIAEKYNWSPRSYDSLYDLLLENGKIISNVVDRYFNGRAQVEVEDNNRKVVDENGATIIPQGTYDSFVLSEETPYIIARSGEKTDVFDKDGNCLNAGSEYENVCHVSTFKQYAPLGYDTTSYENIIGKENVLLADNANNKVEILKIVDSSTIAEVEVDKDIVMYGDEFTISFTPKGEVATTVDVYIGNEKVGAIEDVVSGKEQSLTLDTKKQEILAALYTEEPQEIYIRGNKTNAGTMVAKGEVTFKKKDVIVKADNVTVSLGDAMPELTYVTSGLIGDEKLDVVLTTSAVNTNTKGEYDIVVGEVTFDESSYYIIEKQNGKLIVEYTPEDVSEELKDVVATLPEIGDDTGFTEEDKSKIETAGNKVVEEIEKLGATNACDNEELLDKVNKVDAAFIEANTNLIAKNKEPKVANEVADKDKLPKKQVEVKGLGLSAFQGETVSKDTYFGVNVKQSASEGTALVLEIEPYKKVGVDGSEQVIENTDIKTPVTFKVYLNESFAEQHATIKHYSDGVDEPHEFIRPVLVDDGGRYVEVTVSHFSKFEVIPVQLYEIGDINQDGEVNNTDVTRLYAHLNGTNPLEDETIGDLNGDIDVNNTDVTRLYAHLNKTNPFE